MTLEDRHASIADKLEAASNAYIDLTPDRRVDRYIIEMVAQAVIPHLRGSSILELGVGDRVWTEKLLEKFEQVCTVDASATLIAKSTDQLGDHPLIHRWSPTVSLFEEFVPNRRFDTVLASYVIDHLVDPHEVLVRARQRWLEPDGRLVVVVSQALSLHRRLAVCMGLADSVTELGKTNRELAQQRCFTYQEVEQLLDEAGYRVVERSGWFMKPLPNELLAHCNDAQLRGLFQLGAELPLEYTTILYYQAELGSNH